MSTAIGGGSLGSRPDHLVELHDGWTVWKWLRLRGAGFPATDIAALAMPGAAELVERMFDAEAAAERARVQALAVCERALESRPKGDEQRAALGRALKHLRAGRVPDGVDGITEVAGVLDGLRQAVGATVALRGALDAELTSETTRVGEVLRDMLRGGAYREALVWQNRIALTTGLDPLLQVLPGAADNETRKRELTLARYRQRYCVKNDTIGFFGPVGWGRFVREGAALEVRFGPTLLARRTVYFEHWAIDTIARQLSTDPELAPDVAPRRLPTVRLEGTTAHVPIDRRVELPVPIARVLAACDGEKTARAIAEDVCADPALELTEDDVFQILLHLVANRLATWTLEVPTGVPAPERTLRTLLERACAGESRDVALGSLAQLEEKRDAVARAAGDARRLEDAMRELEQEFTEISGAPSSRRGGEIYAGRTPVYEDCLRDVDLALGPALLERLGPPLSLLVRSARWYTFAIAAAYRAAFEEIYAALRSETGSSVIDYLRFREKSARLFTGSQANAPPLVREVAHELRSKWSAILAPTNAARIERSLASLEEAVAAEFRAPHPGWPLARYHSPDVLLAGGDTAAIRRGDYLIVLGELHVSINTLLTQLALLQHPSPDALLAAREVDLPSPGVAPVESKEHASRADHFSLARHDLHVEIGSTRSHRPRSHVLAAADLVIEEVDGRLFVRTRDGRPRFDIVAFHEQELVHACVAHFGLLPAEPHTPRVTVDGVVIARETWRLAAAELTFAQLDHHRERWIGARRWARSLGLPRCVFFKVPEEPKPCYLDFDSPVLVENFARLARKAETAVLSEMLPGCEETWLTDAEGRRYTSELRIAVVDPEPWRES